MNQQKTAVKNITRDKSKHPIITVKNLIKQFPIAYGHQIVLKDINIEIYAKDLTILYGPSGCGKSTLLHSIAGLETPNEGNVYVKNTDIYKLDEDQRSRFRNVNFGIVYQSSYWLKSLTVVENVAIPLYIQGMTKDTALYNAHQALVRVGMKDFERFIPTELSGGQQQKVAVARAIVTEPEIIIADEPTGNLDSKSAADIISLFKYLNEEMNRTIIMVTHNMAYLGYATRIIAMKDGEIQESDKDNTVDQIIKITQSDFNQEQS